jgi:hypothetical protein
MALRMATRCKTCRILVLVFLINGFVLTALLLDVLIIRQTDKHDGANSSYHNFVHGLKKPVTYRRN